MEEISSTTRARPRAGANTRSCPKSLRDWLDRNRRSRRAAPRRGTGVAEGRAVRHHLHGDARREGAGAAVRKRRGDNGGGARVLANMLGSSKERYALAVGLDPDLSTARDDRRDAQHHEPRALRRDASPKARRRSTRSCFAGDDIDLTKLPVPEVLAGRRRPLHRHRRHHADAPRPTPAASMSAATGRCCTARAASACIARPASTACSTARRGGRRASPARWSSPTASIRCCSCSARRCSARRNPSSTSPAA